MRKTQPPLNGIELRDVLPDDLPVFFQHQLDPLATQMAGFPSREKDAFMAHWAKTMANESVILKTIVVEGQVAGNLVSWEQDGEREVGYWLGRDFWGRGIATRALTISLGYIQTRPLVAYIVKHNIASRRVLEKCGFTLSKELPDELVFALQDT